MATKLLPGVMSGTQPIFFSTGESAPVFDSGGGSIIRRREELMREQALKEDEDFLRLLIAIFVKGE